MKPSFRPSFSGGPTAAPAVAEHAASSAATHRETLDRTLDDCTRIAITPDGALACANKKAHFGGAEVGCVALTSWGTPGLLPDEVAVRPARILLQAPCQLRSPDPGAASAARGIGGSFSATR
ncbi:MAG: hypothetical protein AMXMBFR26_02210 [Porticoccaceae bacterium]